MAILLRILSWALIFILRLRFRPGKSIAKIITDRLSGHEFDFPVTFTTYCAELVDGRLKALHIFTGTETSLALNKIRPSISYLSFLRLTLFT